MGHFTMFCNWENNLKPNDYKKIEKQIEEIACDYYDDYCASYTTKSGAHLFKGKHENRELNILRFYLGNDIFVKMDYNKKY